ncbi:hypothetical protein [Streptomyces sp. Sge12]|uniref:hypothetical protein n=1 Tax=Streptomyces sp. Sge12 TaxID=1972846 RepID=UPI001331A4BA|nr:hypothetical protein [Streptomyces sp. Sge12]
MSTASALAWAALPEFLGSLTAGLVIVGTTWLTRRVQTVRRLRRGEDSRCP